MKPVCDELGFARSNIHLRRCRPTLGSTGRTGRTPQGDHELLAEIREQIAELPSYGYRRACALVNRKRASSGAPRVNPKRVYRVMAGNGLLLPRRRDALSRAGRTPASFGPTSDTRWCSDGFEIKCDSGQTVTATFAKDCCDREIMAFRAWEGKGLPGEPVREMLIEAVREALRGGGGRARRSTGWSSSRDNGSAYIAHETRRIARSLGLTPVNTPVCSPQSNGMAESFVNTFRRDYVSRMDLS